MAIAQLTHLHLTIPSSGSPLEPVPLECYPVVPLSRESAISRRALTALTKRDMEPLDRGLIQFAQPAYVLFPSEESMDDSDGVLTLGLPSLPTLPGFIPAVRPGDIPEPAGPSSLFDSSPTLPGWHPRRPGSRPGCAEIIFDAFSDCLCAFRGFCGVHVFFGGI